MRALKRSQLLCALLLLMLAAGLVQWAQRQRGQVFTGAALAHTVLVAGGWRPQPPYPVADSIVAALDLDDYIFRPYSREGQEVALYVGFYHSAAKVGAAHDPLVCFQGQGWVVSDRRSGAIAVRDLGGQPLHFASLVAEREGRRELVVYWFQSGGRNAADTLGQKLAMLTQRLRGGSEANAFVRLSTRLGDEDMAAGQARIEDFIQAFYPAFHRYVTGAERSGHRG